MNRMYDGNKMRRDVCSAVCTVGARISHAIPTMLALRRGSRRLILVAHSVRDRDPGRTGRRDDVAVVPADDKSIAICPVWRNPGSAVPRPRDLRSLCRVRSFRAMSAPSHPDPALRDGVLRQSGDASTELAGYVGTYQRSGDVGLLLDQLKAFAKRMGADELKSLANDYREMPEVVIPFYEHIVAALPSDAQAIVVLANAYWLTGRGPDVVGQMASRAKELDPANRGAWHLWALAAPVLRKRVDRWHEVAKRFPSDQLARAALADNATSLANDEEDPVALKLAIATYEGLLAESTQTAQRLALEHTLQTLRSWRL